MIKTQPFDDETLKQMVYRLNRGDVDILWQLLLGYKARLTSTMMYNHKDLIEPGVEVHDAVMDAFVALVRKWPNTAPVRNHLAIEQWLLTVVVRWNIDQWRRRKHQREYLLTAKSMNNTLLSAEFGADSPNDLHEVVHAYEQNLDPTSKVIWEGSMYEKASYADLAEKVGWTKDQVKHHLSRLRQELRSSLR